jgi:hypothetical protein
MSGVSPLTVCTAHEYTGIAGSGWTNTETVSPIRHRRIGTYRKRGDCMAEIIAAGIACFIAGTYFGVFIMCLMAMRKHDDK